MFENNQCPECGYDIFCKKIVIFEDYVWDSEERKFCKVDKERETEELFCPGCDKIIDAEKSEKKGKVILAGKAGEK